MDLIPTNIDDGDWCQIDYGAYITTNSFEQEEWDSESYSNTFGNLYNWYAAVDEVCPEGWHVASENDWQELELYLGMSEDEIDNTGWRGDTQGNALKSQGTEFWNPSQEEGTNSSGFNALGSLYNCWQPELAQIKQTFFHTSTENGDEIGIEG